MFENALRARLLRRVTLARNTFGADDHHFARLHIAQVHGVDQIESAGFRGENVGRMAAGNFELAHRQWTEAAGVAGYNDAIFREEHQRERAFQLE